MSRLLLLTTTILIIITLLPSARVQTQQPEKDQFPKPETYPSAGPNCKNKVQLAPWLGMPGAGPGKNRCRLTVYNCQTDKTDVYESAPRESETVTLDCSDYERAKDVLAAKFICCDPKCEQPAPWFGSSSACRDVQSPVITDSGGQMPLVTLYICGLDVFHDFPPKDFPGGVNLYKTTLAYFLKQRIGSKVCCDKLREAVRTKKPCDPTDDIDCDGKRNSNDFNVAKFRTFPDINNLFTTPAGAPVDPIPRGLNPDDTEFFPPQDKCDCKWELMKGTLTCSSDGKQSHVYQARWRCPSSGNEKFTKKEAPATAPCGPS